MTPPNDNGATCTGPGPLCREGLWLLAKKYAKRQMAMRVIDRLITAKNEDEQDEIFDQYEWLIGRELYRW